MRYIHSMIFGKSDFCPTQIPTFFQEYSFAFPLLPGVKIYPPGLKFQTQVTFCLARLFFVWVWCILFSENCSDIFIYVTIRDSKRPCYHPVGAHQQPFERVTKNHLVKHCNYIFIFKPDWFMWCACSWIGDIYARTETGEGAPCLKRHSGTQTGPRPTF